MIRQVGGEPAAAKENPGLRGLPHTTYSIQIEIYDPDAIGTFGCATCTASTAHAIWTVSTYIGNVLWGMSTHVLAPYSRAG